MPLEFQSESHGPIAFGFFNIDIDLLLLERYFFFADAFCEHIIGIAHIDGHGRYESTWTVYDIPNPADIGDLMGAIHGIRYTGFIGEVYRRFPFPEKPEDFKQKPEGFQNRDTAKAIISKYAATITIPFTVTSHAPDEAVGGAPALAPEQAGNGESQGAALIGEVLFTRTVFLQLIQYVWLGGYPRWRNGIRPDYVKDMKDAILRSRNQLFDGIAFDD